jgi:glutamate--cysteine ligase
LEHEKLLHTRGGAPVPYEGGVEPLLARLAARGYTPFRETPDGPVIALERGRAIVSLEPGGQLELSGTPFVTAREAHAENLRHVQEVSEIARDLGLWITGLGYRPYGTPDSMPWMPKERYRVMHQVLPTRGGHALDMMLMTATAQVSLDFSSEADCARKMTVASRMSPLLVALYANSPLVNGGESGFQSFRAQVWTDVDPARCGFFPAMVDGSFSYQAYLDWALDVPLIFLRRQGRYLTPKLTFRQLVKEGYEGKPAVLGDFVDHLSTLFPEVRLKQVLEVRGADAAPMPMVGGLAALYRGILYDAASLDEALALLPEVSFQEHLAFGYEARRHGLAGAFGGRELYEWVADLVDIARRGLARLDPEDLPLLEPLAARAASKKSPAQEVLDAFRKRQPPAELLPQFAL